MKYIIAIVLSIITADISWAQEFYSNKTITIYSNNDAGSNPDLIARIFAEHLRYAIPKASSVVVVNKPGGQGIIGPNYLSQVATKDGTNLGYFTNLLISKYFADKTKLDFDPQDSVVLFQLSRDSLIVASNSVAPNLKSLIDNKKTLIFGVTSSAPLGSLSDIMAFDIMNINVKIVKGYKTNRTIMLAVESGELTSGVTNLFTYMNMSSSNLVPMWTTTNTEHSSLIPDIETAYTTVYGEKPSGIKWDAYKFIESLGEQQLIMLSDTPKEAIVDMKLAVDKISKSIDFKQAIAKIIGNKTLMFNDDAQAYINSIKPNPEILSYINQYQKMKNE